MKVVTSKEMQEIDRITIEGIGMPAELLMGYAGKAIADYISFNLGSLNRTAVFCGNGNNGGDGLVIAYLLFNKGFNIDIYIAGDIAKLSGTSTLYLNICNKSNINISVIKDTADKIDFNQYDLIVDALLGTGFEGAPRGVIKDCIEKINSSGVKILSVDLPSGLPADGEAPEGEAVKADYTITIGLPKVSLVTYPGKQYTGELYVADIGFPSKLTDSSELHVELIENDYVMANLSLAKDADSHKGDAGHILLAGGFDGMEGAIIMAAVSAFESGAGMATLLTTNQARNIIAGQIPELITRTLPSLDLQKKADETVQANIRQEINNFFRESRRYDALVIGPGMGRSETAFCIFSSILDGLKESGIKKVIIDGDGLFYLAAYLQKKSLPQGIFFILTPHFMEASRLLGKTVENIKNNRLYYAKELAKKTSAIVVLKGPATIITDGANSLINTTGNPALGTAGSGDVLSGIIGALLLKDMSMLDAAGIGVYIHGLAGDIRVDECKVPLMKATDIIDYIHDALDEATKPRC